MQAEGLTIEHNLVYDPFSTGDWGDWINSATDCKDVTVQHNTFVVPGAYRTRGGENSRLGQNWIYKHNVTCYGTYGYFIHRRYGRRSAGRAISTVTT